jgi:MFS family permease
MLIANSSAILTDAFPADQRGLAMGVNQAAAFSGTFIGLILGGFLAPIDWRMIFLVSVPVGLLGTIWGYVSLRELGQRHKARIDWMGNITFAVGMVLIMVGITYGIEPYCGHTMGWQSPFVISSIFVGVLALIGFCVVETRVAEPMFRLQLFKIRPFFAGISASFLAALSRGGLMFMLVIWLQGIWLPLHGYSFARTPLWAGIAMIPLTVGMLTAGPISGILSDRFGARPFATGGMVATAICFILLETLPVDFNYAKFGVLMFFTGMSIAAFGSPNRAAIMNSLPPEHRCAGSGMNTTFQNSAQVFSIGIFFTLLIIGLSGSLSTHLYNGLVANGVPVRAATIAAHLPPVSTLFAAFLGYNPVRHLVGAATLSHLTSSQQTTLLGHGFFPMLIASSFRSGLRAALDFAIGASLLAAYASWSRGKRYVHGETTGAVVLPPVADQPLA